MQRLPDSDPGQHPKLPSDIKKLEDLGYRNVLVVRHGHALLVADTHMCNGYARSDHVPREEIAEEIEQLHLVGPVQRLAT